MVTMNRTVLLMLILILSIPVTIAHTIDFNETKKLIESGISCDKLTEDQLEAIGDYYMELMHPGEQHEIMDRMMGGEGSESLRQAHINMALRFYCGQNVGGMMGMMQNIGGYGMMQGMMGNYGWWNFWGFLAVILFIGLIILVYLGIIKLLKDILQTKTRK